MADTLTLGGISFDGFSTPSHMGAGGKQAMVIHKLPGGSRVIDTLGPDDENISWSGEFFGNDEAAEFIRREQPQVVMYVMAETSTGVFERGDAICKAAHEVGAVVIADCVTSLGAMPVDVDKTGIDVAYSCTQKGLSCPPGLSPITVSPRAAALMPA